MSHTNKPCPECGGSDRFYLITAPNDGGAPYWRCRVCDHTEPHDDEGDDGTAVHGSHNTHNTQNTPEQIAEAHAAYTTVAHYCAGALWSRDGRNALDYLRKRGLTDDIIRAAHLGWCGDGAAMFTDLFYKARQAYDGAMTGGLRKRQGVPRPVCKYTITIPYFDGDTCVLLRGRKLVAKPGEPKYLSPAGSLYAGAAPRFYLHHVLKDQTAVILTEGEIKALVAHQEWRAGRSQLPCVATSGAMYLPQALIEALHEKVVYLAYDNEVSGAGERAVSRNGNKLRAAGITVKVIQLPRAADQSKVDLDSFILSSKAAA